MKLHFTTTQIKIPIMDNQDRLSLKVWTDVLGYRFFFWWASYWTDVFAVPGRNLGRIINGRLSSIIGAYVVATRRGSTTQCRTNPSIFKRLLSTKMNWLKWSSTLAPKITWPKKAQFLYMGFCEVENLFNDSSNTFRHTKQNSPCLRSLNTLMPVSSNVCNYAFKKIAVISNM